MTKPMTEEEFLRRANKLWNGKFDYRLVKYTGLQDKITIICPIHGKFMQVAAGHLYGKDCKKCARPRSKMFYV